MALAAVLALAAAVAVQASPLFLDQAQASFVTSFKIPAAGVWQSFTPSWSGRLSAINVLLGASTVSLPCVPYSGVLQIYLGAGAKSGAYFSSAPLLTQNVVSSSCQCNAKDCVSWQQWVFDAPIDVVADQEYSFFLSHDNNAARSTRIATMVVDSYPRGQNHFTVPGYDFAFKTFMDSGANAQASSDEAVTPKDSTSPMLVFGVGIIAAIVAVLAVVLLLIYRRRERMRKEWMSAEQALAELRTRFGGEDGMVAAESPEPVTPDSVTLTLEGEHDLAYVVDVTKGPMHNNWILEEKQEPTSIDSDTVTETDLGAGSDNWTLAAQSSSVRPRARTTSLTFRRGPMALPGASSPAARPASLPEDDVFANDVIAETDLSESPAPFSELPTRTQPLSNNWILQERPASAPVRPRAHTTALSMRRGPMALPDAAHVTLDFDDSATVTETDMTFLPPTGMDVDLDD